MILSGTLVNVQDRTGKFDNDQGESVQYDFVLLTLRTESGQLVEVKVRREDAHAVRAFTLYRPVTVEVDVPGQKPRVNFNAAATAALAPVKSA